jgi:glutaredoxin
VGYQWIDVSIDEEAQREAAELSGRRNIPVIALPGGRILVEPSDLELRQALVGTGLLPG